MTQGPTVDASGLIRALRELGAKRAKKVLRKVSSKYTKRIRAAAIRNAPEKTGDLRRGIRSKIKTSREGHTRALVTAGGAVPGGQKVNRGGKSREGDTFYASFQEYGFTDRGGKKHEGINFLADALASVEQDFTNNIVSELDAEIKAQKDS